MSEENFTNPEHNLEPEEQFEELSKADAMSGIFTAPVETYEAIAAAPKKNYWILPVLITVVVGWIATFLFFQDSELATKSMDKQKEKMRERFEQNVKEGKMTQEDVDKAMDKMDPKGGFTKMIGFVFGTIAPFFILFVLALVYFVILKIMKSEVDFGNILNVVGLALLITAIGSLIGIVISILKGDVSSAGLAIVTSEQSVGAKIYNLISKLDVFNIWFYVVVGIGISKIAKTEIIKSMIVAFIPFVLYLIVTTLFA